MISSFGALDLLWLAALAALLAGSWLRRPFWALALCVLGLLGSGAVAILSVTPGGVFGSLADVEPAWTALLPLFIAGLCLALVPQREERPGAAGYALVMLATVGALMLAHAPNLTTMALGALMLCLGAVTLAMGQGEAAKAYPVFAAAAVGLIAFIYGGLLVHGVSASPGLEARDAHNAVRSTPVFWLGAALAGGGLLVLSGLLALHAGLTRNSRAIAPVGAALLAVLPAYAVLFALARLLNAWPSVQSILNLAMAAAALVMMTAANLCAARTQDLCALLAYSASAQVGYLLMGLLGPQRAVILFAFAAFALAHIGAVAALAGTGCKRQGDQRGLAGSQPGIAVALLLALLSLAAIPPLAGFVGRFGLLQQAHLGGFGWLALAAAVNSIVSIWYYLRTALPMFLDLNHSAERDAGRSVAGWLALLCGVASVGIGIAGTGLALSA